MFCLCSEMTAEASCFYIHPSWLCLITETPLSYEIFCTSLRRAAFLLNSYPGQVAPAQTGPDVGMQSSPLGPAPWGPMATEEGSGQPPAATDVCLSVVCVRVCPMACPQA